MNRQLFNLVFVALAAIVTTLVVDHVAVATATDQATSSPVTVTNTPLPVRGTVSSKQWALGPSR